MTPCVHCEAAPAEPDGLCRACGRRPTVRHLYRRRPHHTPEFLARLTLLRRRADRGEPLFRSTDPPPRHQPPRYAHLRRASS